MLTDKEMAAVLEQKGYGIIPPEQYLIDIEKNFLNIWNKIREYTMTSVQRGYALYQAVKYVISEGIDGDFVECGVWRGGSCMLIALTLAELDVCDRLIWLYDTFEGMTEPGDRDFIAWNGRSVHEKWKSDAEGKTQNFTSWAVPVDSVQSNISATGYPGHLLRFVKGPVELTLKQNVPENISLLRLDTDWYESTKAEMEVLYPVLSPGGVLLIDDYGHFTGARAAVDEYFSGSGAQPLLNRVDYTGRVGIKKL